MSAISIYLDFFAKSLSSFKIHSRPYSGQCGEGWTFFNGSCYWFGDFLLPLVDAEVGIKQIHEVFDELSNLSFAMYSKESENDINRYGGMWSV